ncbi:transcriptional regulator LytR [Filobacillus milosensis]|uniref:Transcriptional regulator LytR n=2 Tax=Filobacillus milosensis TaxID=94137 RepID=A0A4Y8IFP7_9BACI|nr:transcriptional regulator LytR [Filobacillus milosensis]
MYTPLESDKNRDVASALENEESINILLLGVDKREGDKGRSDTMMLLSLNPHTNEMLKFNIPRDTYVEIPGVGMDKINHAYAFGGSDLSVRTVENFLDTTVHYYAKINMEGLVDVVDAMGGITVQNDIHLTRKEYDFPKGELTLSGQEALIYTRIRKEDPRGDLGRNDRQQKVINAFIEKASSVSSVTKVDPILDAAGENAESNVDMATIRALFKDYRSTRNNQEKEFIEGSGKMMGGVWYYVVPDSEIIRLRDKLTQHMEAR